MARVRDSERKLSDLESPTMRTSMTGRAFYESIGSPKMVLAPMVDQSEFVCLSLYLPATVHD